MSLASSPDLFPRPEDKAFKMLFPSVDEAIINTFDEFLDKELYCLDDDSDNKEDFGKVDVLFTSISSSLDHGEGSPPTRATEGLDSSPTQPWRRGLWCLNEKEPSELLIEKTRSSKNWYNNDVSPAHLVNNENYAIRNLQVITNHAESIQSPMKLPMNSRSQSNIGKPVVTREATLSPSPMYAPATAHVHRNQAEAWQQDFQNFHLCPSDEFANESLVSVARHQYNGQSAFLQNSAHDCHDTIRIHSPTCVNMSVRMSSTRGSGRDRIHDESNMADSKQTVGLQDHLQTPPEQENQSYTCDGQYPSTTLAWTTESIHPSDSSHNSHESHHNSYNKVAPPAWLTPSTGNPNCQQPSMDPEYRVAIAAPAPRRMPHQLLQQQREHQNGLGIQYPAVEEIGKAISYYPTESNYSQMPIPTAPYHQSQHVNALAVYPPLPPPPSHGYVDASTLITPKRCAKSTSRSPSPPVSPTPGPRNLRQRSPTRTDYSHQRRKSIHKSGPIKDATQEQTNRSRSSSKPPRTPKTPKTPTGSFAQIDFVNFTPKDASKLLNDVAPSGSSKTRARREQEAREKRKRLSEAALQAVRRAGGDVTALEAAIMI